MSSWEDEAQRFEVIRVEDLPYAHNPYQCRHAGRFATFEASDPEADSMIQALDKGRQFFDSLTRADFKACRYHEADWAKIAECAIEVLALGPDENDDYDASCEVVIKRRRLRKRDRGWLDSLFSQPIDWAPGCEHISNGQHRICALRAAGVKVCVVRTN